MYFADTFSFQLVDKCVDIAINRLASEKVLECKQAAFAHHPQCLAHQLTFVGLRSHLVKNKIADSSIKLTVREIELRRIAFTKLRSPRNTLDVGVSFTLLLGIVPHPKPQ